MVEGKQDALEDRLRELRAAADDYVQAYDGTKAVPTAFDALFDAINAVVEEANAAGEEGEAGEG